MDTLIGLALAYILTYFGADRWLRARGYRGAKTDHFNGKVFQNIGVRPRRSRGRTLRMFTWLFTRPKNDWKWQKNKTEARPQQRVYGHELVVTFVNHATVLIQTEGLNILTDPVWSKRASPFSWLGPKRYRAPGIRFEDLPPIDLVLISHNHYDHMDLRTLRRLKRAYAPKFITGLGNGAYLGRHGVSESMELDWWQSFEVHEGVTIRAVPAQHFSSRAISDRNKTLWMGFVIETSHGDIYFAGDTGYGPFISELKERYDTFRLGLIPIGAYVPSFIMSEVHLSPQEAYRFAHELRVDTFVPIHYGTFRLADDKQDQPLKDLEAMRTTDAGSMHVAVLENGQHIRVPI